MIEVGLGDRKALPTQYQAHSNKEQSYRGRAISKPTPFSLSPGMTLLMGWCLCQGSSIYLVQRDH